MYGSLAGPWHPPAMQESTVVIHILDFVWHGLSMRVDVVPDEMFC